LVHLRCNYLRLSVSCLASVTQLYSMMAEALATACEKIRLPWVRMALPALLGMEFDQLAARRRCLAREHFGFCFDLVRLHPGFLVQFSV